MSARSLWGHSVLGLRNAERFRGVDEPAHPCSFHFSGFLGSVRCSSLWKAAQPAAWLRCSLSLECLAQTDSCGNESRDQATEPP